MKTITGRPVVTVRRSLGNVATVLAVDTLPPVPEGVTHTWLPPTVAALRINADRDQFLWFRLAWNSWSAMVGASEEEVRAELAEIAHRLAAVDGYTGHLKLFLEPFFDLEYGILAVPLTFPNESLPEVCG